MKKFLQTAVEKGIITSKQAEELLKLHKETSLWGVSNLIIYFGGLVAIGGVSYFVTLGFMKYGYKGILFSALFILIIAFLLLSKTENKIAKGVIATFIIALVPMSVYGLLGVFGYWTEEYRSYYVLIDKNWLILEISTIIAALIMLRKIKYPFLILPIAFSLWFMSMDIVELIVGKLTWEDRKIISLIFGMFTIFLAVLVDLKNRDFAFWLYIFGVVMFWGGLSLLESNSEVGKFIYFLINIFMLFVGTLIRRKVFLVFGGIGVFFYFIHLADDIFKNTFFFPIIVALMGLWFVNLGVKYKQNEEKIRQKILKFLPEDLILLIRKLENT